MRGATRPEDSTPDARPEPLRVLGRYELLQQVGSGGMAVVYRGRDSLLDREVAVKLLHPHLATAAESRARFSREARAVARLAHPGIVEIYDYSGDGAGESYLVTEFVRGPTLRVFAQEVGFGFPEIAMLIGRALADALVHAHSAGVIHRDLKPENVLVRSGEPPAVKLADFGIARILASDERMTLTGALVGSPHHMAPEIIEGKDADARCDVFSLGTILYWLATGKLPFAAANPTAILRRVLEGDVQDPRAVDPRVPDPLAELVLRCLAVAPGLRPQQAAEVRDGLDRVLAQVGLDRPDEALVAFLRDPAGFRTAFPARAVATLAALGDGALAEGASARALGFWGRALAIDPSNAAVLAKVSGLTRRRRLRRAGAWTAGSAGALALLLVAGSALLARRAAAPPAPAAVAAAPEAPEAAPPAPPPSPAEAAPAPTSPGGRGPARPAAPSPAAARPAPGTSAAEAVPLAVYVRPYAQRALLDGVEVARDEQVVHVAVPPGAHELRIEHACCAPFVRSISAAEAAAALELRVPLLPRPARLRVDGEPGMRVLVNGAPAGTAGESQRVPIAVPVPSDGPSPYEGTARIALELEGAARSEVTVKIRAGESFTVAAPPPGVSQPIVVPLDATPLEPLPAGEPGAEGADDRDLADPGAAEESP